MITVISGVNGAGKSSIAGEYIRDEGGEYFNPDEVARRLIEKNPTLSQNDANAEAWQKGYNNLLNAITNDDDYDDYAFETTLGGNSITESLLNAVKKGISIRIFYIGLTSPELHIERVHYRVSKGGHDIPEEKIRERYIHSTHNFMTLLPFCTSAIVFDNSSSLINGQSCIKKVFTLNNKTVNITIDEVPEWAKPIVGTALKHFS